MYRALERFTDGEAAKVLSTVKDDNCFEAWRQLHLRCEPELEAQRNVVLADLHNLAQSKIIDETRSKTAELKVRVAKAESTIASHIMCSQFQPKLCSRSGISTHSLHFEVHSGDDMVLRPLQQLLRVCALVQAGGNLNAYDPPKLYGRFPKRDIAGGQPGQERDLSSPSGSGGCAGGNSTARRGVLSVQWRCRGIYEE